MFDLKMTESVFDSGKNVESLVERKTGTVVFWAVKRSFDIAFSLLLLPFMGMFLVGLLVLNPFFNRGRLFYVQKRMGKGCIPFSAIKFRSMSAVETIARGPEDPIEADRISAFGRFLRKLRIDELPQILNVLKGDMSLIGPRPDYFEHALVYLDIVPGYAIRHTVRPGISGLAQVSVGYVSDSDGTCRKVAADISYIENVNFKLESWIIFKTFQTVVMCRGA